MKLFKRRLVLASFLLSFLILTSCDSSSDPIVLDESNRGKIIETEFLANYSLEYLQAITGLAGDNIAFTPLYAMNVYKVVYYTPDPKGNIVVASGAIFIPEKDGPIPLLSAQHGTQSKRTFVASVDPSFSIDGLLGASLGYYVVVADYLGLGDSEIIHPYHHAKSSATCIVDIIRAAKTFATENEIELNDQLFLAGYSEGGYVTLATQRELETYHRNEFNITAVSAMAGAYDLMLSEANIILSTEYNMPGYLAFIITAHNSIYEWNRLGEIFQEPYTSRLPSLFDGTNTIREINSQLTTNISNLFNESFISSVRDSSETYVLASFVENSLLDFTPISPLLLVHGNSDEYVPYENSTAAYSFFTNRGATNIELVTIEGGTHSTSVFPAIVETMNWFNNFTESNTFAIRRF